MLGKVSNSMVCALPHPASLCTWSRMTVLTHSEQHIPVPCIHPALAAIRLGSPWMMTCSLEQQEGQLIACAGLDNTCSLYSRSNAAIQANRPLQKLALHDGYISCCTFLSPASLVTASGDTRCIVWDVEVGMPRRIFSEHHGDVLSICRHPTNDQLFISGSSDRSVKLWDCRQARRVQSITCHAADVNCVTYSGSGQAIASASDDGKASLLDVRYVGEIDRYGSGTSSISCVAFSKSARMLFLGTDVPEIQVWDTLQPQPAKHAYSLRSHTMDVTDVKLAPNGYALASTSHDATICIHA